MEFSVTIRLFDRELTSPTIVKGGETSTGYQAISFYPTVAGKYSMDIGYKRDFVSNSPFYFTVIPGKLNLLVDLCYYFTSLCCVIMPLTSWKMSEINICGG